MNFKKSLSTKEIVNNLKEQKLPIIIFGAGITGKVLYQFCRKEDIRVACFCDNSSIKAQLSFYDKEVVFTPALKEKYSDAIFLISAADIKDVVEQLQDLGYSKWYAGGALLRNFDISQAQRDEPADFMEYAVGTCVLCHDSYLSPEKLFLRSIDIIITERCSLRCKDCSNLMQYYENPKDCNIEKVFEAIDAFCSVIDEVNECRVIGGEPLMNKQWHLIVKRLVDEPKIKKVIIYTNGTIMPNKEQITYLKNAKVLMFITDYGSLSKNLLDLAQVLEKNGIAYYIRKAAGWTACATIVKHHRNITQKKEIFRNCCAKNLITLSDGKLYKCPFAANTARLLAIPNYVNDYIDLLQEPQYKFSVEEMKDKLRDYFLNSEFLETCDYCNGRTLADAEIEPAVQVSRPLKYKKYNF